MDRLVPIVIAYLLAWAPESHAQLVRHHSAASSLALPVSVDSPSPEAMNPASLTAARRFTLVVHVARPYHLPALRHGRVGMVRSGNQFATGLFVERLGYEDYGETTLGLTGARKFEAGAGVSLSVGMRASVTSTVPRGYDARRSAAASIGWLVRIDSVVAIGASLNNVFTHAGFVVRQAPVLSFGAAVRMTDSVTLALQLHRERGFEASLGVGVAFAPPGPLTFRVGTTSAPVQLCGGVGFDLRRFTIDLGFVSHPVLGLSSSLTLGIRLA